MWTVILILSGFVFGAMLYAYSVHLENKEFDSFKVNILEFEHYPGFYERNGRRMVGYAKVTWEGQDFPVELCRTSRLNFDWVFNKNGDRSYCQWECLDDFNLYFTIPPQVHYRVNEEWRKCDREDYEKKKAEYVEHKKQESGLS